MELIVMKKIITGLTFLVLIVHVNGLNVALLL